MKNDAVAKMATAVAVRNLMDTVRFPPVITVPAKKIKNPKEWTVMETTGVAINGSHVRYNLGDKLYDALAVKLLRAEGVKIEATA
jgi:hypothetical protein